MRQMVALLVVITCVVSEGLAFQARGGATGEKAGSGACSFLSKELVMKVSGSVNKHVFDLPPEEEKVGKGTACSYADIVLQVDVFTPDAIDGIAKKAATEWTPLSGIGDAAYFRNNKNNYAEIIGRVGTRTFTIQLGVPFQSTVEKTKPNAVTLAHAIVAKLR